MTSWIILLIKQYIDIVNIWLIGDAIFDLNNERTKRIKEKYHFICSNFVIYVVLCSQIEDIWIDLNALICLITVSIIFIDVGFLKHVNVVVIAILITTLLEQFIGSFITCDLINICSFNLSFQIV